MCVCVCACVCACARMQESPDVAAADMKAQIKKFLGMEDEVNPDDAEWVTFFPARTGDSAASETKRKIAVGAASPVCCRYDFCVRVCLIT